MKKEQKKMHIIKYATKCITAAALTLTIGLLPCFSFSSQAYTGSNYDNDYDWDDLYYDNFTGYGEDRRLTNVTKNYDDGTTYKSEYQYNDKGQLISANIKEPDGSKVTMKRTYKNDVLVSEAISEYDANYKLEKNSATEFDERGYQTHSNLVYKFSDGTSENTETWFLNGYNPLKIITVQRDGLTTQADYTYNGEGELLTCNASSSDGSISQEEYQYDGSGQPILYKLYEYDASTQIKTIEENHIEGEGETQIIYTLEYTEQNEIILTKEENWYFLSTLQPIKQVIIDADGNQSTANYTYNSDGKETLYIKVNSDGTTEKRESSYSITGDSTVYSDGKGNTSTSSTSYDIKNEVEIYENMEYYADGSTSYSKRIYGKDYNYTYITRDKAADGTETYTEIVRNIDGKIRKEKTADGIITVTEEDPYGTIISQYQLMPDGSKAETIWTELDNGRLGRKSTQYSDGTEDRIDYEYDEDGELIKETETRRNGVSAVSITQFDEENDDNVTFTQTFNNGYQITIILESIDEDTAQLSLTYSIGDISQDIIIETEDLGIFKTIFRDGRIEETIFDTNIDDEYLLQYEKLREIIERVEQFIELAWSTLPSETASTATPSDAAPAESEAAADDAAPAESETAADDAAPAESDAAADDAAPAESETAADDAAPAESEAA